MEKAFSAPKQFVVEEPECKEYYLTTLKKETITVALNKKMVLFPQEI